MATADMKRSAAALLAAWTIAVLATPAAGAAEARHFQVDPFWPNPLPNNWILGQVSGLAIDAKDHVWIVQRPSTLTADEQGAALKPPLSKCCIPAPPVIEFDPAGNVVQAWGGPGDGYDWPSSEHGILVDPKGFVWLAGNGDKDGMVLKFTREGKFVMQIGHRISSIDSTDTTRLGRPADIAMDPEANEVYVADGYGDHRVAVFDADTGAYKRAWGAYGKPPTDDQLPPYDPKAPPAQQFRNPVHCVKLSRDGLVYVCDRTNDRIQVFRKDGTFVTEYFYLRDTLGPGSVWDVAFWPDRQQTLLFTADGANNEVRILVRATGEQLSAFGRSGRNAGQFHWLHNLGIDSKGNVYTSEVDTGKRIQKFRNLGAAPRN